GQRGLAARRQLLLEVLVPRAALLEGRNVGLEGLGARALRTHLGRILALQLAQVASDRPVDVPLQRGQAGRGVAPVPGIDRPEFAAVDGEQRAPKEVEAL